MHSKADVFGIAYKPHKKKDQEYEVPKGPAFDDEAEFERDFRSNSALLKPKDMNVDDDDEFDIDDSATMEEPGAAVEAGNAIKESLRRAAEKAALAADEAAKLEQEMKAAAIEESRIIAADNSHTDSITSANTGTDEPGSVIASSNKKETGKFDVRQAAKESFGEISSIYGSGLGDIEVRLLDSDSDDEDTSTSQKRSPVPSSATLSRGGGLPETIAEEDEEEEEREELREREEVRVHAMETQELEAQWDAVVKLQEEGVEANEGRKATSAAPKMVIMAYAEALSYLR